MKSKELEDVISQVVVASDSDEGLSSADIFKAVNEMIPEDPPSHRTFMRRLAGLVDEGKIIRDGITRAAHYRKPTAVTPATSAMPDAARHVPNVPVSAEGKAVQEYVRRPLQDREPAGYEPEFLEDYTPNHTYYLPETIRRDLSLIGEIKSPAPTGSTYQPETVNQLLIELPWASSRLEGNTYSLIDTQNLVVDGVFAEGKDQAEADMILNHKYAIDMLLENAESLDYNMYTFLSLHHLLSDNLMGDPGDCGRLRQKIVRIGGSVYNPPVFPQQVEDYFRMFLDKARDIEDPLEQSFFTMVHLPYLQPFTDVNKRTARLGANIPLIKNKLCPLSFIDVPHRDYTEGNLGVYELNDTSLLKDVYVWAYERSCRRYNAIKRLDSSRDPYRTKYKRLLYAVTGKIVKQKLDATDVCIAELAQGRVVSGDTDRFINMVNDELQNITEMGLNRYGVSLDEFNAWKQDQSKPGDRPGSQ